MTAVASPPSLQSLHRWENGKNGGDILDSRSTEDLGRGLQPNRSPQRPFSSIQIPPTSTPSTNMNASTPVADHVNGEIPLVNGDHGGFGPRKKAAKFWPTPAGDTGPGPPTRTQPLINGQSGPNINPGTPILPQHQPGQQNGIRSEHSPAPRSEASALLALQPLTSTFERKHISVPFFPEVQKVGRQTNQKTVPAANNGYFDSKVLSRQHAEIWADRNGKIWIRDVKSSNGTFVNGVRLSQENKESEPHELREGDQLELGIDIVSEDQKSIVHHKVSAKVELAGLYNNTPNFLDAMHIDPTTGQALLSDPTSQHLSHLGSKHSLSNSIGNTRLAAFTNGAVGGASKTGLNRQMNMWMGPITVEQVVKKLNSELKQAKRQSQDLHRTGDFFDTLLNLKPGEEMPTSPSKLAEESRAAAERNAEVAIDGFLPFSQPPAPPPSQPLPEKPDGLSPEISDAHQHPQLQRADTERSPAMLLSSTRQEPQSGQILSLLEALKTARQELDSQGSRMKYLESALKRERRAREIAERRARALSGQYAGSEDQEDESAVEEDTLDPPLDSLELVENGLTNGSSGNEDDSETGSLATSASMETLTDAASKRIVQSDPDDATTPVEDRLELLKQELRETKVLMEGYRRHAEEAEEGRQRFADMVANIRAGHDAGDLSPSTASSASGLSIDSSDTTATSLSGLPNGSGQSPRFLSKGASANANSITHGPWTPSKANGKAISPGNANNFLSSQSPLSRSSSSPSASMGTRIQEQLERTLSAVISQQHKNAPPQHQHHHHQKRGDLIAVDNHNRLMQSAPYVSMVGVVLIGVGVMTWLNGWQSGGSQSSSGTGAAGLGGE